LDVIANIPQHWAILSETIIVMWKRRESYVRQESVQGGLSELGSTQSDGQRTGGAWFLPSEHSAELYRQSLLVDRAERAVV
jgi:hypothetical protein